METIRLFSTMIGGRQRHFDPDAARIAIRVVFAGEDPNRLVAACNARNHRDRLAAVLALASKVRKVFDLPPFDKDTGRGVRVEDCIRIWNEYWKWQQTHSPA